MSYFSLHYHHLKYPINQRKSKGLRTAQLGAMHAIGSYFTLDHKKPAIVVMPTGSGKTSVLISSAFIVRAQRVLVITPSVLVRGQIFEEFENLTTLRKVNAFSNFIPNPKVLEQKESIKTASDCENFKSFDVVVSTPNSFFPILNELGVLSEIFDLLVIDEAHHAPAKTWNKIINSFSGSKRILFTATPYRRDKKEIVGDIIYNYPLSKAYDDKIFGDINYIPIAPDSKKNLHDLLIAKKTEEIYFKDRKAELDHSVLIRTSTKKHAKELLKLYSENTKLKLRKVDSSHTNGYIKQTIKKMKSRELHGIICVDMLGEGFDFPQLKIGAIHSPHKSLAITLQFIGRFARTNAPNIGEAKFIAIADEEIEIEKTRLFGEDNIWKDIIIDLSENRIGREDQDRKVYKSFLKMTPEDYSNISLYSLAPYSHVKIYKVDYFSLESEIRISGQETVFHEISEEWSTIVLITKIPIKPKWIHNDAIIDSKHSLFIIYYNRNFNLLFICSTDRSEEIYSEIKEIVSGENIEEIPASKIRKVLVDLKEPEFFNIGMANRLSNSGESYRIISGSNAEKAIRKSDGRLYNGGHVFAKAQNSKDESITIGYSTRSKVWRNAYSKIPDLINWCDLIGTKILSNSKVNTNSGFDNLSVGEVIKKFPSIIYAATWNMDTFKDAPFLSRPDSYEETIQLLEVEININKHSKNQDYIELVLTHPTLTIELIYSLSGHFKYKNVLNERIKIEWGNHSIDLINYLNDYSLTYYLQDFSYFSNHEWYKAPLTTNLSYNSEDLVALDWHGEGVNIQKEFGGKDSIHEKLREILLANKHKILIYDHGTGEMADFIAVDENKTEIRVEFFHVKGAGGQKATSNRVDDVYEVCGQAIKSLIWIKSINELRKVIKRRTKDAPEKYLCGSFAGINAILNNEKALNTQITIVQPGITKSNIPPKIAEVLAANNDFISRFTPNQLKIITSL